MMAAMIIAATTRALNGPPSFKVGCFEYMTLLTIRSPTTGAAKRKNHTTRSSGAILKAESSMSGDTTSPAAIGLGRPVKLNFSTFPDCTLNLASLSAAQTA